MELAPTSLSEEWTGRPVADFLPQDPSILTSLSSLSEQERDTVDQAPSDALGVIYWRPRVSATVDESVKDKGKAADSSAKLLSFLRHQVLGRVLLYLASVKAESPFLSRLLLLADESSSVDLPPTPLTGSSFGKTWTSAHSVKSVLKHAKSVVSGEKAPKMDLGVCGLAPGCDAVLFTTSGGVRHKNSDDGQSFGKARTKTHFVASFSSFLSLPQPLILRVHATTWLREKGGDQAAEEFKKELKGRRIRPEEWR